MTSSAPERFFFPHGFVRRPESAPGSLDEIRILDGLMRELPGLVEGVAPAGSTLWIRGWAIDPAEATERTARAVICSVGGARYFEAAVRAARLDVALDRGNHELKMSGFTGSLSLAGLQPGRYPLALYVLAADGEQYFEVPTGRAIEIVSSRYLFPSAGEDRTGQIVADIASVEPMRATPARRAREFSRSDVIVVRGTAYDRGASSRSAGVFAVVDDHHYVTGVAGLPNPELQSERSGYVVRIPARDLGPGPHRLRIAALGCDSLQYASTADIEFEVLATAD